MSATAGRGKPASPLSARRISSLDAVASAMEHGLHMPRSGAYLALAFTMIESRYWRTELRADLAWLKRHRTYRRRSEKQLVLFERKLMLAAFQIRSLLERPKVNDSARSRSMPVLRYKKIGNRPFTATGPGWPHERFDMESPESDTLSALDVCNQLIHYYWMQTLSEGQAFTSMLVFSDYKRHKWAYEFRIENLLHLFQVFGDESSCVIGVESRWDDKKQDFVITKSRGPGDSPANILFKADGYATAQLRR